MSGKRVLAFGLNYPPERTGVAPYTAAICQGLVQRGYAVRIITAHPHYPDWEITNGYGQWRRTETIGGVAITRLLHYVPKQPSLARRAASEATLGVRQSLARWGRPTAIVAVSPALLATAGTRIRAMLTHPRTPFVVWVQDLYGLGVVETGQGPGWGPRVVRKVERWLLRAATCVVVIHPRFADRVHEDFGVPRDRIVIVRNWTHLGPFPPVDVKLVRERYGWKAGETVILHAGNMGVKQGLHHIIEAAQLAASRATAVRFVLLGNGSQRSELERLASLAPARLQFLDPLDDNDFTDALQAADVLLVNELPGVAEMAVPSKLTSYFAAGRPILAATDANGITAHEVHTADAGTVVPAGDPAAILEGALELAADPVRSSLLGVNGKSYKERVLNEESAIDRFDRLLAELTRRTPPRVRHKSSLSERRLRSLP